MRDRFRYIGVYIYVFFLFINIINDIINLINNNINKNIMYSWLAAQVSCGRSGCGGSTRLPACADGGVNHFLVRVGGGLHRLPGRRAKNSHVLPKELRSTALLLLTCMWLWVVGDDASPPRPSVQPNRQDS